MALRWKQFFMIRQKIHFHFGQALTESVNPTDYLKKLRKRDEELGSYLGTNCPHVEIPPISR